MAAEPALDRSSKCSALPGRPGRALPAHRSGRRLFWPAGLILIGLAGGVWAYQGLKRPARDPDAIWRQAEADFVAGRLDRAGAALKRLGQLRKPSPLDQMLHAQLAAAHNALDEALACLADVPDDHYMAPRAQLLAGQIELRRDRARRAEVWFDSALKLDSGLVQAHRELIYIYGMQLRRRELSGEFLALSALAPLSSDNVFHWCLLRTGSWEPGEAVDVLRRYVAADPLDRPSRLALAENYRRMGQTDMAESVLEPLSSADAAAVALRAQLAIDRQDVEEAERLLASQTSDLPALARLRGRLALSRRDAQTAWHHFRIAFQSDPEDRETVFGLVYALELAGQSKAAGPFRELAGKLDRLSTLIHRAALRKARQDATLLRQLGDACAALHRDPEARAWYEQAIALDFQDSEAQRALYRLRRPGQSGPSCSAGPARIDLAGCQILTKGIGQLAGGFKPLFRLPRHRSGDGRFELLRKIAVDLPDRLGFCRGQIRRHGEPADIGRNPERLFEQKRLEQRDTHRIDITLDLVGILLQEPLGCHVDRGPGTVAHLLAGRNVKVAPQAKVTEKNATVAPVLDQQVGRLDVAVRDPIPVRNLERSRRPGQRTDNRAAIVRLVQPHERM